MALLAALVATVFGLLALLHVYWALGGRRGAAVAVPEVAGAPAFSPPAWTTLTVALGLVAAALVVLAQGGIWRPPVDPLTVRIAAVVLGGLFVVRAVGDFRLVGFFKKVRGTAFARNDTRYYSPLALALGIAVLWLAAGAPPERGRVELVSAPAAGDLAAWIRAEVAARPGRAVLVYEGAAWCEPCTRFRDAARAGRLDDVFPGLTLLELDADLDGERLVAAGYGSRLIPLFAVPAPDGRASEHKVEGGIKGEGAVAELVAKLRPLVDRAAGI